MYFDAAYNFLPEHKSKINYCVNEKNENRKPIKVRVNS